MSVELSRNVRKCVSKARSSFFEGHTAEGSINYLGTSKEANYSWLEELSPTLTMEKKSRQLMKLDSLSLAQG